ncbi:Nitrite/Sulfite reductase ferredoxin-like half domain-containing protein [Peptoclostridium litorale DSM 5388]|uniref:Sulfite reductase, assimilatory-type n=1 Tax=Peptoclostridium litorale DSM 5388 TaxID=1121324 RepID=A0A069RDS8_PEPLI|nr:NAD(P)/FAD-dependent oxidoreductase [Peptoclostridium litorale]KDR95224.1 sulfite reductase, assimilatory-type [Peptoclostridium litorale DSM 5388]SIN73160.1 Nitrite/Sulfite reductase ferredoxin-like half domain-containing protein [Peptoclostridium litorale DSM 5388]
MGKPNFSVLQKIKNNKKTYGITPRIPGGFVTPEILVRFAEVAKKYHGVLKITSGQRITILGINPEDVDKAWADIGLEPGVLSPYSVKNVEMCPASFCKRSKQNSLKLALKLEKRFYGAPAPNRTKVGVSGCLNACTSVNSKDIGILSNENGYIVVVGGSAGFYPRLPDRIADNLTEDQAFYMVESIYDYYCDNADTGEKLGSFIDRIALPEFKKSVFEKYEEKLNLPAF